MISHDKLPLTQIEFIDESHKPESITEVIDTNTGMKEANQPVLQHSMPFIDQLNTPNENIVSENIVSENIVSENIVSEKIVSENIVSENIVSENIVSENIVSEKAVSENIVSENIVSENIVSENIVSENIVSENIVSEKAVSENIVSENIVSENIVSENIVSENIVSENIVSENIVSENIVSENIVSENIVSENIVSENIVSENIVSENIVSKNIVSENIVSENIVSENIVSEKAADHENSLNVNDKYKMHNMNYNDNIITAFNARRLKPISSNINQGATSKITLYKLHEEEFWPRIEKLFNNKISPLVIRKDYSIHNYKLPDDIIDIIRAHGGEEGLFEREVNTLKLLFGYIRFPQLLCVDAEKKHIYMTYSGNELTIENIPKDWKKQLRECIEILKSKMIFHNDMIITNLLVYNNVLNVIDFGFSTYNNDEFPFVNIIEEQLNAATDIFELIKKVNENGFKLRIAYTRGFNACRSLIFNPLSPAVKFAPKNI